MLGPWEAIAAASLSANRARCSANISALATASKDGGLSVAMAADENTDARADFSSEHPDHHVCANTETWTGGAAAAAKARESGRREMMVMVGSQ